MSPEGVVEAREWFRKADYDLKAPEVDMSSSPPLSGDALFHCQQAAEKAMKGFLTAHDRPFKKTHDLDELGRECAMVEPALKPALDSILDLTVFAWAFRYPGDMQEPGEQEALDALCAVRRVVSALLERIGG